MARTRRKLGEQLKHLGLLTDKQLQQGLNVAKAQNQRIGETLVELGHVTDSEVAKALAAQFEMEFIDLDQPDVVSQESMDLLPKDLIQKYLVLPIEQKNGRLKILIHDPLDLELLDNLRFRLNCEIDTVLGSRSKIKDYIDELMGETKGSIDKEIAELSIDRGQSIDTLDISIDQDSEGGDADSAPTVRLVNQIITEAVQGRASDIHIEPFDDRVRLRYRIDGVCQERDRIPKRTQASMVARLKIMAGVRVEEKRNTQDGRIKLVIGKEQIDFRVSFLPSYHGESVVLRILRPESARIGLVNLGMREDTLDTFNRIIRRPNGIFLVTGPTGSGKTTTLYSALDVLNRPDRKIITAEDPVEYNFKGINQCQVNEGIELSFSRILRAILRQAPNVVLVGEIRDLEVATVAIQAALTGHLVFSTLHTNDAPSAITRLVDIGVKPFLVASSIQAILAQRLVRILCEECKEPETNPSPRLMALSQMKPEDIEGKTLYRAVGCKQCGDTGYHGRRGIYELMVMNSEIRELAFKRAPLNELRAAAEGSGMRNLLGDGKLKVLDGETTLEEISRVAQVEGMVDIDASGEESEVEQATT